MVRYENHCCDCAAPAYPCRGSDCPLTHIEVHYCDECKSEIDEIYDDDGGELCEECLLERHRRK